MHASPGKRESHGSDMAVAALPSPWSRCSAKCWDGTGEPRRVLQAWWASEMDGFALIGRAFPSQGQAQDAVAAFGLMVRYIRASDGEGSPRS
jgi:hypothetical protein